MISSKKNYYIWDGEVKDGGEFFWPVCNPLLFNEVSASVTSFLGETPLLCHSLSPWGSGLGHGPLIFPALNPHCNLSVIDRRVYSPSGHLFSLVEGLSLMVSTLFFGDLSPENSTAIYGFLSHISGFAT